MSDFYRREIYLSRIRPLVKETEIIKVLTGMRRCGKSSIMHLVAEELLDQGVDPANVLFLDLNAKQYKAIKSRKKLEKAIESGFKGAVGTRYLFIDEVQNVKKFEETIEAFRLEKNYSIFITGSNAKLLSSELTSKLTGRYIEFRIGTLIFPEYLAIKSFFGVPVSDNLEDEFSNYLQEGGLPYAAKLTDFSAKRRYIQNVVEEIHEKDIKKSKRIHNRALFDQVEVFVINNFGSTMSVNSLCDALEKTNGHRPSPHTIYNYLEVLKEAKVLEECERFDIKSKKALKREKKYYLTDLGIYFATNVDGRINYGPVLENVVFNYALALEYDVAVGKIGALEVDFILSKPFGAGYAYVQVAKTIETEDRNDQGKNPTEEREYRPLEKIHDNYPKYLLTLDKLPYSRSGVKNENIIRKTAHWESFGF